MRKLRRSLEPPAEVAPVGEDLGPLLAAARRGSSEALGEVLEASRQYLLAVAEREMRPEIRSQVAPSDLVQETFVDAQRGLRQFRGATAGAWRAWLRRTMLNNLIDHARRRSHGGTTVGDGERPTRSGDVLDPAGADCIDPRPTPATWTASRDSARLVDAALARLPEAWQQVIRLRHQEDLPFACIAVRMNRSEAAARKLWQRAMASLQLEFSSLTRQEDEREPLGPAQPR